MMEERDEGVEDETNRYQWLPSRGMDRRSGDSSYYTIERVEREHFALHPPRAVRSTEEYTLHEFTSETLQSHRSNRLPFHAFRLYTVLFTTSEGSSTIQRGRGNSAS